MQRAIYFILFLMTSVRVALAQEVIPLEEITFSDWRYIMSDEERTPSDCIGIMKSPLCAIDTNIACDAWTKPRSKFASYSEATLHPICEHVYGEGNFSTERGLATLFDVYHSYGDYRYKAAMFRMVPERWKMEWYKKYTEHYINKNDQSPPSISLPLNSGEWAAVIRIQKCTHSGCEDSGSAGTFFLNENLDGTWKIIFMFKAIDFGFRYKYWPPAKQLYIYMGGRNYWPG